MDTKKLTQGLALVLEALMPEKFFKHDSTKNAAKQATKLGAEMLRKAGAGEAIPNDTFKNFAEAATALVLESRGHTPSAASPFKAPEPAMQDLTVAEDLSEMNKPSS